jgi:sigma-B regulation protein RsbU (phosphoserine phosphatase)
MRAFGKRALTRTLALLFALAMVAYALTWMVAVRQQPSADLGAWFDYSEQASALRTLAVTPGGPAARGGLRAGDLVRAVDGEPLVSPRQIYERIYGGQPGDRVALLVDRRGQGRLRFVLTLAAPSLPTDTSLGRKLAFEVVRSFPIPFVAVGLAVLFARVDDRNAWLLALLFAGFVASAPLLPFEPGLPGGVRGFAIAYKIAFSGITAGVFLFLFSVFPVRSFLDTRSPWLKHVWLAAPVTVVVPLAAWTLVEEGSAPLFAVAARVGGSIAFWVLRVYSVGGFALGLFALVRTAVKARTTEARRRSRVILWGALLGVAPGLAVQSAALILGTSVAAFPFWVWAPVVIAQALFPVSLAYAIVRHRVIEIPVLLRRSARYLLVQRGSVGLLVLASVGATLAFSLSLAAALEPRTRAAMPIASTLGVGFGIVLLWAGRRVQQRVRERIDRAFFRGAYDAQHILQDLADRARHITDRRELARLMERHIHHALLPRTLFVYLRGEQGPWVAHADLTPIPRGCEMLSPSVPILDELARRGRPWEPCGSLDPARAGALGAMEIDCLVPMLGRDGQMRGLLVLGPRLSEEPYARDDTRLLASVADQAGLALESLALAQEMTLRLEAERLAAHDMELARQVQVGLLPQRAPTLVTLECVGECLQTKAVGGDYFDFVEVDGQRLGLVLADISGKGFPAALLMASLQASLRSRPPALLADLPGLLGGINQLLFRYSAPNRFATLFFGLYDDRSAGLSYANCGHNPPMLLRASGTVERLVPTAPLLGLIEDWGCATGEVALAPGDLLAVFSDGVTEAFSDDGEEFGEDRLAETLRRHADLPLGELLSHVIGEVTTFSGSEQDDDLTMVLARRR